MIGIISDIHGNYFALKEVLEELDRKGVSEVICLGDVAGYYCQINECCEELRKRGIFSILGNHDYYLVSESRPRRSRSAAICLDYQRKMIREDNLMWLSQMPISGSYAEIKLSHGGWNDPLEEYLVPNDRYFDELDGMYFCSGHTHVPKVFTSRNKIYCNPGSVGQPRDGDPRASYAIWEDGKFELFRVEYDIEGIQNLMKAVGFEPNIAANLSYGLRIGSVKE